MAQLVGLVLAGGAGRRMGIPKGGLQLDGRTLAERAACTLWPLCGTVLISIQPGVANPAPAFDTVEDAPPPGRGPLAGIAAAFAVSGAADLLVLACDYPAIETGFMRALLSNARADIDLVMPTDAIGRDHPLVGLWKRSAESAVAQALAERHYKVAALMAEIRAGRLGPADFGGIDLDRALVNVNTPEDLAAL